MNESRDIKELRGHHVIRLHYALIFGTKPKNLKKQLDYYDEKGLKNESELYWNIITGEIKKVKITDSLDDICKAGCVMETPCCADVDAQNTDKIVADDYGLIIGSVYNSQDLIENIFKSQHPFREIEFGPFSLNKIFNKK